MTIRSFLPFYFIQPPASLFFCIPRIYFFPLCCFLTRSQQKNKEEKNLPGVPQGLTHLGWYFALFTHSILYYIFIFFLYPLSPRSHLLVFFIEEIKNTKGCERVGTGVTQGLTHLRWHFIIFSILYYLAYGVIHFFDWSVHASNFSVVCVRNANQ